MTLTPLKMLLEAADQVIEMGLEACRKDNPGEYQAALDLVKSGAVQRIVIDIRSGNTTIDAILIGRGDPVHLFQYAARSVGERH